MNLFEQIKKLRNQSSSSSTSTSTSSSSTQSSDDDSSQSNTSSSGNNINDESETNNDDNDTFDSDTQFSFWKQGPNNAWGPVLIEYKIQPNKIEKKLGMFQSSFSIPEYEPFKPHVTFKSKRLYEMPKVSRIEIEDIMSQRNLFDE